MSIPDRPSTSPPAAAGQYIGRYRAMSYLGSGGMADVFKCELQGLGGFGKLCVVKRMKPELVTDEDFVAMFLDEARLVARLNHPNIVQVFEIDEANGVPFIAMELVRGPTLSRLQRTAWAANNAPLELMVRVLADASLGLAAAHAATDDAGNPLKIVHRDVSPQNIMISAEGMTKILDFGVAKAEGKLAKTATGLLKGKVAYMSPEQLASNAMDARADVYSLGVCLYHAVTGKLPFAGANDVEVLRARLKGEWASARAANTDVPEELDRIISRALAQEPDQRQSSASQLHEELEAFLAGRQAQSDRRAVASWIAGLFPDINALVVGSSLDKVHATSFPGTDGPGRGLTPISQQRTPRGDAALIAAAAGFNASSTNVQTASMTPHTRLSGSAPTDASLDTVSVDVVEPEPRRGRAALIAAIASAALALAAAAFWFGRSSGTVPTPSAIVPPAEREAAAPPPPPAPVPAPPSPEPDLGSLSDVEADADAAQAAFKKARAKSKRTNPKVALKPSPAPEPTPEPEASPEPPPPEPEPVPVAEPEPVRAPPPPPVVAPPPPPPVTSAPTIVAKPKPQPPEAPELPARQRVYVVKDLVAACARVEAQLKSHGHLDGGAVDNVTAPLARVLAAKLVKGDVVEIHPSGMYWFVIRQAAAGKGKSGVAQALVRAQQDGSLNGYR